MKKLNLLIYILFTFSLFSHSGCAKLQPNVFKPVTFDFINNTTEACHMYFLESGMNYTNYVSPNSFITKTIEVGWAVSDGEDKSEPIVKVAVGRNQEMIQETKVYIGTSDIPRRYKVTWDGKELDWKEVF